jgi:hypothetical protein
MKVAQNDETNPDTQPVRPPHTPNISNSQLSPSGSSTQKRETPGKLSRMFSPFAGITSYHDRAPLACRTRSFPPPVPLPENAEPRGYFPGCFPPFIGTTYYRDWAHLASRFVMSCIVMHLFALYSLFLPPLLSGRLQDRRRCWCPDRLRC